MRSLPLALIALLALAAPAFAQWDDDDRESREERAERIQELIEETVASKRRTSLDRTPPPKNEEDREAARQVYRVLDTRKVTVNFDDTPFLDALDFIRDVSGLNIVVSKQVREAVQDEQVTIDLRLTKIKLRNCWELLLKGADLDLRYGIKHGVLFVGLKEEWEDEELVLRFLDIGDLLHIPPDFPGPKVGLGDDGATFSDD